jgi:hypothetical protein
MNHIFSISRTITKSFFFSLNDLCLKLGFVYFVASGVFALRQLAALCPYPPESSERLNEKKTMI